jgi:hypothetical protein
MDENSKQKERIIFGVFIIVLVIIAIFFFLKTETPDKQKITVLNDVGTNLMDSNISTGEDFFFPKGNFELTLQPDWVPYRISDDEIPIELFKKNDIQFSFSKKNTSCVLSYGLYKGEEYIQTSFADRVFTKENIQIDSSWYIPKLYKTEDFKFLWEGEQSLPYEVRFMAYPRYQEIPNGYYVFALFDKNSGVVDRICDKEFSKMLSSLRTKYNTIDKIGNGIIYFMDDYSATNTIVFIPSDSDEGLILQTFNLSNDNIRPFLKDNNFYYLEKGVLKTIDLLTGEQTILSGIDYGESEEINNFSFIEDKMYYFLGAPCNEYLARCDNELYQYDLKLGVSKKLATGSKSRNILGVNKEKNLLYIMYSDGDAGCWWMSIESYDFNTNQIKPVEGYSGYCEDDPDKEEIEKKFNDLMISLRPIVGSADHVVVKDKKIYPSKLEFLTMNPRMDFRYILDN